ncbi:MAG TPA: long-chain fatty acid--CoA ligase [Algoriphagus sp.]|jgi:long-chain acyl-CoA synthetase|uniref:AMP-dependent synthetase/ligase n=1 Tax=Algoriphagus TaxID=246875 RepID=UPI000C50E0E0|nr:MULTISPECIES: long-chain fatty acid--CoA ligase [Algoriphagus]MAL12112.1 long-chain fatty acid--CoA ligase [Algoriphagus sp.]QYH40495.1 long-chain fatty acid--CoA ligase [Algoriphagus sp. NBT04N3]HAH38774.1 long-chain fatty acid--CoA ligase [Algoriphagus sp.]HAS59678.1 long-chain fatty acid--CoA ligase [Algoriphagus sp.]HCB46031.1 long-chain fatty acid--CoA ligase [Algoriphagus sp.]
MELNRLFDLVPYQIAKFDKTDAVARKENGEWITYSSRDVKEIIDNLSLAFMKANIAAGDRVAIISENRPEWNFVDLALQQIGAISVPMYPTITSDDYAYIFDHAEVKMIFVGDTTIYEKAIEVAGDRKIYSFDKIDGVEHWTSLKETGLSGDLSILEKSKAAVKSEDLFTIIYTSGTTGRPKGVMLTHHNVLSNVLSVSHIMSPPEGTSKVLSFLPLCHIFERTASFCFFYLGFSIYYAENMDSIGENLKEVQPHVFNTVPRLLEKVYDKIVAKGYELSGIKKQLFFWALNLGLKYDPAADMGGWYNFQLKIANQLIFSKWREALGGNIMQINSGASALQPRLARVFWAAGIKVCEGYGLTETSPVVTASISNHEEIRIGWVGKIVKDVEVKIAEDGEILVKGPNVMQGYYKNPEMTAEVLKNGWFHTGDIGELDGNYLRITDRKKEMFKTSGGKYIAPQVMENKFKESTLIEQLIVVGDNRNFPGALIVPSFDGLREYCKRKDIPYTTDREMIQREDILEKYQSEVDSLNKYFGKWEQIKRFRLLPEAWGVESGELTPTMKLKRKVIHQKYADEIEAIYQV